MRRSRNTFLSCGPILAVLLFAGNPAQAAPSYALVSPPVVEKFKAQATTAEGQAIIRAADGGLAKQPDPLASVHIEAIAPGAHDPTVQALRDFPLMLNFALAYRMTGDARYLDAEERYLAAWLKTYQLNFNAIDETLFDQFILAYDLTGADLTPPTRRAMEDFLHKLATGYLSQISRQKEEDKSNWQSHRIKLITLAAFALGDETLEERAQSTFNRHILVNIAADGTVWDFGQRDAIHYVTYDLEPLAVSALVAKAHGQDWTEQNPAFFRALDWLLPYVNGQKTHEEFVHSTVPYDAERAQAGVKGFSGQWQPASGIYLFQLAAILDVKYQPTFEQIITQTGAKPQGWLVLLARVAQSP